MGLERRENARAWKGGTRVHGGRKMFYLPEHPRANGGQYVYEHILIVEKVLGKHLLRKYQVHHVDEDVGNNKNNNLVVCEDHGYHMLLHRRKRAFEACGHVDWRKCWICGE